MFENSDCINFAWDCDWQYCDLKETEIDPHDCATCPNYKCKEDK